jgi:cytoskeletal protein CcmA (bactofilin family)
MNHLDELIYLRYLDGQLARDRAAEIEKHIAECASCRGLFEGLERETSLLRNALSEVDEPLPKRFAVPTSEDVSWAWLSVAALAVFGLSMFWNQVLEPWWNGLRSAGMGRETLFSVLLFQGLLWRGWTTMADKLVQGLGLVLLTGALAATMHWGLRVHRTGMRMLAALVVALGLASSASAAVIESTESYLLPAGGVIANDLIVTAQTVRIDGTIEGDLIAFAQTVSVTGRVAGDVLVFAQRLQVTGQVDGNVRSFGEFQDLEGLIARNVTVFGETVQLHSDAEVSGSFTSASETSTLDGRVGRDLIVFAETSTVNGTVGGNARLAGETVKIGPNAAIAGELTIHSGGEPDISADASLSTGPRIERVEEDSSGSFFGRVVWRFLAWAASFIYGLVVLFLAPRMVTRVMENLSRYGISIGLGALALVAIPIAIIIVCLTLVGIPLGLVALAGYVLAIYSAQVFVGSWIGQALLGKSKTKGEAIGRLALGLAILHIAVLVPVMGGIVSFAVLLWGFGAFILALLGSPRSEMAPA